MQHMYVRSQSLRVIVQGPRRRKFDPGNWSASKSENVKPSTAGGVFFYLLRIPTRERETSAVRQRGSSEAQECWAR